MLDEKIVEWDLVIEPQNNLLDLKLKDVWRYRDLLIMFVKRDFVSFYKQTILGPLWFFVQPLFTTIVFTYIFGGLAGISTDGVPAPLFYLSGITAWNYFADCLTKTSTVFKDNANIFGKVYFPRLILPLSIVVSNLVRFGVQFLLFLSMLFYYSLNGVNLNFTWVIGLFPLLIVLMALLGLGLGLIITAMTTRYRDLAFMVVFGIQLLMYATTVIYPLSSAPDKYKKIIQLNPMTSIIEAFRYGFFGQGELTIWSLGYTTIVTIVAMVLGIIIFNKTEKTFVDTI
jgi:lipopolysaccharide transport system permease protein